MVEHRPVLAPEGEYDVAILGGGLAGLCLGLQLKRARPEMTVLVAEKRQGPAPEAAFKVGESTTEGAAHYYSEVLGLKDHLHSEQFPKLGLRFFFPAGDNSDITRRVEFSTPRTPGIHTYQLDRGRLENELWRRNLRHGVHALDGCRVEKIELGGSHHTVTLLLDGGSTPVTARWVVDATGRASLLKRQLGLEKDTDHVINAAWFRLAGGLDVEDWSDDEDWLGRTPEPGLRKHATIHLAGEGYWVWLIQLPSGPISIGLCADPRFHPFDSFNRFDRLMDWFEQHEPQLASALENRRDQVQDFLVVEDFSYSCERVYSPERWCLTGEAGVFADPLFSPGSDFIGYSNSFITDLIVRDLSGEDIGDRIEFYNYLMFQVLDTFMGMYQDQYQFFGNPQVMTAKLMWNTYFYFGGLPLQFMNGCLTPEWTARIFPHLQRAVDLTDRMEVFFRQWHALDQRQWEGISASSQEFSSFLERHGDFLRQFDEDELVDRYVKNVELLFPVAVVLFHKAVQQLPGVSIDEDTPINAAAIGLEPDRWEEDGLFAEDGITPRQAREMLPGIDEYFMDERGAKLSAEHGGPRPATTAP